MVRNFYLCSKHELAAREHSKDVLGCDREVLEDVEVELHPQLRRS